MEELATGKDAKQIANVRFTLLDTGKRKNRINFPLPAAEPAAL